VIKGEAIAVGNAIRWKRTGTCKKTSLRKGRVFTLGAPISETGAAGGGTAQSVQRDEIHPLIAKGSPESHRKGLSQKRKEGSKAGRGHKEKKETDREKVKGRCRGVVSQARLEIYCTKSVTRN